MQIHMKVGHSNIWVTPYVMTLPNTDSLSLNIRNKADRFMEMIDYYSRCTGGLNGKLWLDWVMEMVYSIRYPRIYQRNKFLEVKSLS